MSTNRSVQAAQRRRAGHTNIEPGIPGRGPQPSINSAQMFANQARPGSGPNIPTGRLAGQQAAIQQQQIQQGQDQRVDKLSSVSKMTIPQAITLITLRLGAVESKLMNMSEGGASISIDGESGIDSGLLQSIMSRLESLEKRSVSINGTASTPEVNLLKQQFETVKQAVVQTKGATTALVKENAAFKTHIENLTKELTETKELLSTLQNLTMDNSQKILDLSMGGSIEYTGDLEDNELENLPDNNFTNLQDLIQDLQDDGSNDGIIGTDLKELIESELNVDM